MTRATLVYLGATVALLAVAVLLILYLASSNEPEQASSTVPVATSALGNPVNAAEGALNLARQRFKHSDPPLGLDGDLTSLQYVESTVGQARALFRPAQGPEDYWLENLSPDTIAWVFLATGQFDLSSRLTGTSTPYPAAIALIPMGVEGSRAGPTREPIDLSRLGNVVDVPVPLPPFPTPVPVPESD